MSLPHPPGQSGQHVFARSRSNEAASQSSQSPPLPPYEATRSGDQELANLSCDAALVYSDQHRSPSGKVQRHFVAKQSYSRRDSASATTVLEHTCYSSSSEASTATQQSSTRLPRVDSLTGFFCTQRQSSSTGAAQRPSSSGHSPSGGVYSRRISSQQRLFASPGGDRMHLQDAPNEDSPAIVVKGCFGLELSQYRNSGGDDDDDDDDSSASCEVQEQQAAPRAFLVDAPTVTTSTQRPHTSGGVTYAERYRRSVESYSKQNTHIGGSSLARRNSGQRISAGAMMPRSTEERTVPPSSHRRCPPHHQRSKPAGAGPRRQPSPESDFDDDDDTSSVSSTSSSEQD